MKTTIYCLLFIVLTNCSNNPKDFIEHIDGYWEIESVTMPDGTEKEYTVNLTVDYITVNDSLEGFRKKMNPKFDGTFETSKDAESFHIKLENDSLNLYYKTPFSTWKETVLKANTNQLKIVNQNNIVYLYKRFKPITVE